MKFVYLSGAYPHFAESVYAAHPGLAAAPYQEQRSVIERQGFGWTGAWGPTLGALGWEVMDINFSIEPVQRAWAAENGVEFGADWIHRISFEQIRRFAPDVLLFSDPRTMDAQWFAALRAACPHLRLVMAFTSTASFDVPVLRAADLVLSTSRRYVDEFRAAGMRAEYLRHAFNDRVVPHLPGALPVAGPEQAVVFCGNIFRAENYHTKRDQLLEALAPRLPLHLYCPQAELSRLAVATQTWGRRGVYSLVSALRLAGMRDERIRSIPVIGRANKWRRWPEAVVNPRLRPYLRPALFGLEMYRAFGAHAVTLNMHIDTAGAEGGNLRTFEAPGTGSCLLTDGRGDIEDIFVDGTEVVTYATPEECAERAAWLLAHPAEARAIGLAGQRRALRDHTYRNRAEELDRIVADSLNRKC
jgi:hypothetical protein